MITIFKVDDTSKSQMLQALHAIDRVLDGAKLRYKYHGLLQISNKTKSSKMLSVNANRLANLL